MQDTVDREADAQKQEHDRIGLLKRKEIQKTKYGQKEDDAPDYPNQNGQYFSSRREPVPIFFEFCHKFVPFVYWCF
ncbi:hypothetical protein DRA42_00855 [Ethanoligenens harbinense]|nr:hypothetical protein CXQ68_00840 [Ethanoligenens harbinense YUAN-3]AYF37615.1 hypothetical protein CXP51_00845 [Ethanoligenens harbinense]AYF40335.1 hypothetical protein CN246_00840 [Ethanoligenens harbinense]QCN91171.1 hypothetical protein DRA42_00855 [Ethanoligenens harbinense]